MFGLLSVTPIDIGAYVTEVIETVTTLVTPTQVIGVIAAILGAVLVFVFLWWGARKGLRAIMSAIKNGKASV